MGYIRNDNPGAVRHESSLGAVRIEPGAVVLISDALEAEVVGTYPNITQLNDVAGAAALAAQTSEVYGETNSVAEETLRQGRIDGRRATVTAPLQRVVGDDQAPQGPASGTITTKQAHINAQVGEAKLAARLAFAQGEVLGTDTPVAEGTDGFSTRPNETKIHNQQIEAAAAAEEAAQELVAGSGS